MKKIPSATRGMGILLLAIIFLAAISIVKADPDANIRSSQPAEYILTSL